MSVKYFENIAIAEPINKIYSRLGYAKGITQLSPEQKEKCDSYIEEAMVLIDLKGAAKRISIEKIENSKIILSDNIILDSVSLTAFLKSSKEAIFMAATVGNKIINDISQNSQGSDVTKAVVFDATASAIVDDALSWIMSYFKQELTRENKAPTRGRFSAGYGDFSLDNQKIIYDILDLNKLGLGLTEKYILIPEKSVTAICGIELIGENG